MIDQGRRSSSPGPGEGSGRRRRTIRRRRPVVPGGRGLARRVSLGWLAVLAVGLFAVTELGTRAVEDWLPFSQAGDAIEIELKYDQIRALEDADKRTDVVFFGNSAMDAAIDPAVWKEASTAYPLAYNASLLGQPFDSVRRWADDFVLSHCDPALVVVGITPFDVPQIDVLNTSRAVVEKLFDEAMDGLEEGPLARADRRLRNQSAVLEHRASFRSPIQLYRAGYDRMTGATKPKQNSLQPVRLVTGEVVTRTEEVWRDHIMQPRGGIANYWGVTEAQPLGFGFDSPVQQQIFRSARTSRDQMAALRNTAEDHGARVVFVIPPNLADAYTPFTGSRAATAAAFASVRALATELGISVYDFSEADYPADQFADAVHLNRAGAARFSAELARALDQA